MRLLANTSCRFEIPRRYFLCQGASSARKQAVGEYSRAQENIDQDHAFAVGRKMDAGDDPDAVLALRRRALGLVSECAACSTIDVLRTINQDRGLRG
jgi:hypothetical protein